MSGITLALVIFAAMVVGGLLMWATMIAAAWVIHQVADAMTPLTDDLDDDEHEYLLRFPSKDVQ